MAISGANKGSKAREEDADTDPLETTSQPYMINDDLYSMIIVAKQEDQPCTIKEAADVQGLGCRRHGGMLEEGLEG